MNDEHVYNFRKSIEIYVYKIYIILCCGVVRSEYGKDDETLMENIIDIFV